MSRSCSALSGSCSYARDSDRQLGDRFVRSADARASTVTSRATVKALQTFMGHANAPVTLDLYAQLLPSSEAGAGGLPEAFFSRGRAGGTDQPDAQEERAGVEA